VLLPRLSVELQPSESWYGYVSLARGARSGGINALSSLSEEERGYDPEYNWTSELGIRYRGTGLVSSLQSTIYRIDWTNTQITGVAATPGVSTLITRNTAGITTHGIETQLTLRLGRHFNGSASFSWTDPRFDVGSDDAGSRAFCGLTVAPPSSTFCTFGPSRENDDGNPLLVPYLDDNRGARAPSRMFNIGLQASPRTIAGNWQLGAEANFGYQDSVYERPINGAMYGSRTLLAARAFLERGNWNIALWGTNLTDDSFARVASSRGGAFYPSLPRPIDLLYNEGRRVGLTVGVNFQ
jgi:iron complex outermembrane receptor protein